MSSSGSTASMRQVPSNATPRSMKSDGEWMFPTTFADDGAPAHDDGRDGDVRPNLRAFPYDERVLAAYFAAEAAIDADDPVETKLAVEVRSAP